MSLLNIGYGLGGFMKGLNEQQNQQLLQQLSRLDLQRVQQQIRAQEQYDATAPLLYNYYLNQQEGGGAQPSAPQFGGGPFGGGTGAPTPPAAAQPSSPPSSRPYTDPPLPPTFGNGPTFSGIGDYGGGEPPGMGDYYAPAPGSGDGGAPSPLSGPRIPGFDPAAGGAAPQYTLADYSPQQIAAAKARGMIGQNGLPLVPPSVKFNSRGVPYNPAMVGPGGVNPAVIPGFERANAGGNAQASPAPDIPPAATAPSSPPGFSGSSAAAGPPLSAGDDSDSGTYGRRLPLSLGTGADTSAYGGMSKADYIRRGAIARGLDPNMAMRTVMSEGGVGRFRLGDSGTSGGPFQLHVGGGMGDDFRRDTGKNPLDPRNERATIDYALDRAKQMGGFSPAVWHGLRGSGGSGGGGGAGLGAGGGGGANDAILQQAMKLIQDGLRPVPESMYGNMTAHQMAVQIEKANPNADPVVKMLALERGMKMMAPEERLKTEMYMQQHQDEFRLGLTVLQSALTGERQTARQEGTGPIVTVGDKSYRVGPDNVMHPLTIEGQPGTPATGVSRLGTGSQTAPTQESVDYAAKMISEYRMAPISGWGLRSQYGQQVMKKVAELNPDYDATKYQQKQRGAIAFTSGRQSDSVRAFSVAIDHLDVMEDVSQALANGDVQALNRLGNEIQKQFGYAGPVDFNFAKSIVGDEVSKAVIGGVGSLADRQQLQNGFDLANSPEQLGAVSQLAKRLMAGQLAGYRRQAGTAGFSSDDFDKALSPRAKKELEGLMPQGQPSASTTAAPGEYKTPEDVKAAVDAGQLKPEDAVKILREQFGYE